MDKARIGLVFAAVSGLLALQGWAFAEWRQAVPVAEINTEDAEEWSPFLSFDGLTLYFCRVRSSTFYYGRVFEAKRAQPSGPFTLVKEVDGPLNSSEGHVLCPWVSPDNLRMYYHNELTDRWPLKVSERASADGPWPEGEEIPELNALGNLLQAPKLTGDELAIFFNGRNLPGSQGGYDIWMAIRPDRNSPFEQVRNLEEINTAAHDKDACVSPDGLVLVFTSDRNSALNFQLFMATRASLQEPFGNVKHLASLDSPGGGSIHPYLTHDGGALYFLKNLSQTSRDLWVSYWREPEIRYVDADAAEGGDGKSWATAFKYLQDGLAFAQYGDEVRVAQGVYKPAGYPPPPVPASPLPGPPPGASILAPVPNPRLATFFLKNGVTVKGGYAGYDEPDPNARDIELYETVLSGDLNGDDVEVENTEDLLDEPTRAENSYHVITGSGTDATAILDGCTITAGNANGTHPHYYGGGMYNSYGDPTLRNCTFYENSSLTKGGCIYNSYSSPALMNCTVYRNYGHTGGGMFSIEGEPTLTKCTFRRNSAKYNGGGMLNGRNAHPVLISCAFLDNASLEDDGGGGMFNGGADPTLINCMFIGNTAFFWGGAMMNMDGSPTLTNCTFIGSSARRGGGMFNTRCTPTVTNCTFSGNQAEAGGAMLNNESTPTVTNCILWDNGDEIGTDQAFPITYSDVEGGWPGEGNIDADPLFVDADGEDNIPGTDDDDLRLRFDSPCIDAGDNNSVPADTGDLDGDGNTAEPIPWDLDGSPRIADGDGDGVPVVDMGAYEAGPYVAACFGVNHLMMTQEDGKYKGIALLEVTSDQGVFVYEPKPGKEKLKANTIVDDGVNGAVKIHTSGSKPLDIGDVFGAYTVTNVVKIFDDKSGKKVGDVDIEGTFKPTVPVDLAVDEVAYVIDDGQDTVLSFVIPANSFKPEGKPDRQKFKYDSPKKIRPEVKGKFDFLKCKFELKVKKLSKSEKIRGTSLAIGLYVGRNIGEQMLEAKAKKNHLEYKRKRKMDCCDK